MKAIEHTRKEKRAKQCQHAIEVYAPKNEWGEKAQDTAKIWKKKKGSEK